LLIYLSIILTRQKIELKINIKSLALSFIHGSALPMISVGGINFYTRCDGGICPEGYKVVFSGDILFNMGIDRNDSPRGDYNSPISGIGTNLLLLPE
jgi:hypothetical protein